MVDDLCLDVLPSMIEGAQHRERPALLRRLRWDPGSRITIGFLDTSEATRGLRERVREALAVWEDCATQLTFDFHPDPEERVHVRIAFGGSVSWSRIGTDCLKVPRGKPTMNLALTSESEDRVVLRRARHEFGHALGLIHEHQSPAAGIRWNREVVLATLREAGWSDAAIEENFFKVYDGKDKTQTQYTAFDKKSIMLYRIPAEFTDGTFQVGENSELSAMDIDFISNQYFNL